MTMTIGQQKELEQLYQSALRQFDMHGADERTNTAISIVIAKALVEIAIALNSIASTKELEVR